MSLSLVPRSQHLLSKERLVHILLAIAKLKHWLPFFATQARKKHVGLLEVRGDQFRLQPIALKTVRS